MGLTHYLWVGGGKLARTNPISTTFFLDLGYKYKYCCKQMKIFWEKKEKEGIQFQLLYRQPTNKKNKRQQTRSRRTSRIPNQKSSVFNFACTQYQYHQLIVRQNRTFENTPLTSPSIPTYHIHRSFLRFEPHTTPWLSHLHSKSFLRNIIWPPFVWCVRSGSTRTSCDDVTFQCLLRESIVSI